MSIYKKNNLNMCITETQETLTKSKQR